MAYHLFYMAIMAKKGLQSCGCRTCLPPAELKQAQNQAPRIFPSKEVLLHVLTSPRLYLKLDPTWFIQRIDLRLPLAQLLPQLRKRRQKRLPLLRALERRSDPSKTPGAGRASASAGNPWRTAASRTLKPLFRLLKAGPARAPSSFEKPWQATTLEATLGQPPAGGGQRLGRLTQLLHRLP